MKFMNNLMMVITHKEYCEIDNDIYKTIIVGDKKVNITGAWRDNQGDLCITEKNPYYCELTGLYWVWKNKMDDYDNVGLCHYRRYFTKNRFSKRQKFFLGVREIENNLKNYDVILPEKFYWKTTVDKVYYLYGEGREKDLELTRQAISIMFPEYLNAFDLILKRKSASYCNMFVMSQQKVQDYCDWLFKILFYVEEHIDMTGYTQQEARVFGYLSEILLNVWIEKKKLKIKYYPIAFTEKNVLGQIYEGIMSKLFGYGRI